ncbi:8295_t:CDS:2 [Entrophospora sp. SA101]|nr:8295_t:CDS:2 [Entrophospora sp. SA101]
MVKSKKTKSTQGQNSGFLFPSNTIISSNTANSQIPAIPGNDEKYARFHTFWFKEVMTREHNKHCTNALKALKRHPHATPFLEPVEPIKLNIPDYLDIVKIPMDLSTVEKNLNNCVYKCVQDFVDDVCRIFSNCVIYNGKHHQFSQYAKELEEIFIAQLSKMPATESSSSSSKPTNKLIKKPVIETAFPSTVKTDNAEANRPKRTIKSPNKELPQITQTSRRKKTKKNAELNFCRSVYQELKKKQHYAYAYPFYEPVNAEKLGVPEYYNIIKTPMDLSMISTKLENETYTSAEDFEVDIRLMFENCYKFNPPGTEVYNMGKQLEKVFDKKWIKEEEESVSGDENDHLKALQRHLAALSSQITQYKKSGKSKSKKPIKKSIQSKTKSDANSSFDTKSKTKRPRISSINNSFIINEENQELTAQQKAILSQRIEYLSPELTVTLISIVQQSGAPLIAEKEGGYELEIENIDTKIVKQIYEFVMTNTSDANELKQKRIATVKRNSQKNEEQIIALEKTLAKFDNKSISTIKAQYSSDDDSLDSQSSASSGSESSGSDTV